MEFTIRQTLKKTGEPDNIGELVFALTYKAAYGSSPNEGQEGFVSILQEFSKLFGAYNVADFFPWLGWIHARDFNKRLAKARNPEDGLGTKFVNYLGSLDGFIETIIDEHLIKKKTSESLNSKDENEEVDTDMVDE